MERCVMAIKDASAIDKKLLFQQTPWWINAKSLRNKTILQNVPKDKPGYYKWWATEEDTICVFNRLGFDFNDYKQEIENRDEFIVFM